MALRWEGCAQRSRWIKTVGFTANDTCCAQSNHLQRNLCFLDNKGLKTHPGSGTSVCLKLPFESSEPACVALQRRTELKARTQLRSRAVVFCRRHWNEARKPRFFDSHPTPSIMGDVGAFFPFGVTNCHLHFFFIDFVKCDTKREKRQAATLQLATKPLYWKSRLWLLQLNDTSRFFFF